jgi:PAS domain S-box-containing protein
MELLDTLTWKLVLDAIPDGISVHSTDGVILHANSSLAALYAIGLGKLIGRNCEEVFHSDSWSCPHEEVLTLKRSAQVECRLGNGEKLVWIQFNPILAEGEVRGFVRVARDMSEGVRVASTYQERILSAERFATLGQMVASIAHDVGTPLSIISGYSEYLLMRTKPGEFGHKELSTILQQTKRIADFIKQMLDLTRPSEGRRCAIGLKGFLGEVLDLMGHHLRKRGVKASVVCAGRPPLIYADAPRLRQAFFNLVLNLVERCSDGSELEIALEESSDRPGYVKLIFRAASHDFSGLFSEGDGGIGLSLARGVLSDLGAELKLSDDGERGVSLVVFLPVGELSSSAIT